MSLPFVNVFLVWSCISIEFSVLHVFKQKVYAMYVNNELEVYMIT